MFVARITSTSQLRFLGRNQRRTTQINANSVATSPANVPIKRLRYPTPPPGIGGDAMSPNTLDTVVSPFA